ncbi:hypothetical protein OQA88_7167 [Cercophora sp. LCS_1]
MLDHTGIFVTASQHADVIKWYETVLAPLGYKKHITEGPNGEVVGLSDNGIHADWWLISTTEELNDKPKMHHAFVAKDRAAVDAFHAAALGIGSKDNGKPGVRAQYHAHYYAAFVFDPLGHNIEVVCHAGFVPSGQD